MKKLYSGAFLAAFIMFSVPSYSDQWSGEVVIDSLTVTRVDLTETLSIQGSCVTSNMAYLSPTQEHHKEVLSILLTATVSGKRVELYCADTCASGNRCVVKNARIKS